METFALKIDLLHQHISPDFKLFLNLFGATILGKAVLKEHLKGY